MNVSSGPHVSHIFGMLSTVFYSLSDILVLNEPGQQWDQRIKLNLVTNLKKNPIVCVTQDPGESAGLSQ